MFKSIETYTTSSTSGITVNGPGMVTFIDHNENYSGNSLVIDGISVTKTPGAVYLFKSTAKIATSNKFSQIRATIGVF